MKTSTFRRTAHRGRPKHAFTLVELLVVIADEPFSFHAGGINIAVGDGSCRFLSETIDTIVLKSLVGASDGNTASFD